MSQIKVDTITNGAGTGAPNFPNSISVAGAAVNFPATRTDWNNTTAINGVVGQLAWKNYGNNHTIFDASASTSPTGTAVGNTDSQIAWAGSYPTLMGWNGVNTYGVRVDSARVADIPAAGQVGTYAWLWKQVGTLPYNTNFAGSSLYASGFWSGAGVIGANSAGVSSMNWTRTSDVMAGTWRTTGGQTYTTSQSATTFVRIA